MTHTHTHTLIPNPLHYHHVTYSKCVNLVTQSVCSLATAVGWEWPLWYLSLRKLKAVVCLFVCCCLCLKLWKVIVMSKKSVGERQSQQKKNNVRLFSLNSSNWPQSWPQWDDNVERYYEYAQYDENDMGMKVHNHYILSLYSYYIYIIQPCQANKFKPNTHKSLFYPFSW